jgi:DNA-binding winged helix-turn-helix (wHTH) protein/TolB-like protein
MNERASAASQTSARLALGDCTLDLGAGELITGQGELVALRRQALDLLLVLGRRAEHVVTKNELMSVVWPDVVVGEGSLTQAIFEVRRALGDDQHRLVRTVARRGYMLVPNERQRPAEPEPLSEHDMAPPHDSLLQADREALAEQPLPDGQRADPEPKAPWGAQDTAASAVGRLPGERVDSSAASRMLRHRAALLGAIVLAVLLAVGAGLALRNGATPWQSPADLARVPLPSEVPALSIIVLPLSLDNEGPGNEWLADALHGDLVTTVARLHNSLVIARDTAATYKGRTVDPRQVAREMGVRHVVRGSLRQEGTGVHLNLALIDGDSGVQRWADTFAIERAQLAQAVGDFAVAIERTLTPALYRMTAERRSAMSPTQVTADDLAVQGYALWYRGVTRENVLAARALFERALTLDPNAVRAWQGIQFTTANQLLNNWTDDRAATLRRSDDAMANLERVDPDGSQTYSAKAFKAFSQRDFPAMLRITTEWTERYRLPLAFGAYGGALTYNGRFDEAVSMLERALRLGPRDPFRAEWQYRLALAHFGARRYELARDWSQSAANTNAKVLWPPLHAAALQRLGRHEEARQAFDEHMRRHPGFTSATIAGRIPGDQTTNSELRARVLASLRELGMPQ